MMKKKFRIPNIRRISRGIRYNIVVFVETIGDGSLTRVRRGDGSLTRMRKSRGMKMPTLLNPTFSRSFNDKTILKGS
jgi:hypothetical protein